MSVTQNGWANQVTQILYHNETEESRTKNRTSLSFIMPSKDDLQQFALDSTIYEGQQTPS